MSTQRYAAVNQQDEADSPVTPTSPPPSFHSRSHSRSRSHSPESRRLLREDPLENDLDDAFDASDDENDPAEDDRQRLVRRSTAPTTPVIERHVTDIPAFRPQPTSSIQIPGVTAPRPASDGVFANLSAKPSAGESTDDKPPTYEQASLDNAPPYWETTILAPGMNSDEVYINGLPVGSLFSFIWNGMISMSFLFPGFLLTYLLHTTHAAKNGSLAGLGLTLVQYGFYMQGGSSGDPASADPGKYNGGGGDPNNHNFDPNSPAGNDGQGSNKSGFGSGDFISYALMIVGWFILIRAVSGFLRARREEQLVLQSPSRGLATPVVAEGEGERAV